MRTAKGKGEIVHHFAFCILCRKYLYFKPILSGKFHSSSLEIRDISQAMPEFFASKNKNFSCHIMD